MYAFKSSENGPHAYFRGFDDWLGGMVEVDQDSRERVDFFFI